MASPLLAFAGSPVGQTVTNGMFQLLGQGLQNRANKKMWRMERDESRYAADLAYQREMELLKYQLDYNSPVNQMARFKDAGLNPNLIYGQGTPGNMQSAPAVPQHKSPQAPQVSMMMPMLASMYQDARLKNAQADLLESRTDESGIKQELMKVQTEVARNNPYLAPGYLDAVVSQMKSTAAMKQQEASFKLEEVMGTVSGPGGSTVQGMGFTKGWAMMQTQWQMLEQQFQLGEKDLQVRSQIIQSKEFKNAIDKVQAEWLKNADITPQHVYQFIMMFMQALLRR